MDVMRSGVTTGSSKRSGTLSKNLILPRICCYRLGGTEPLGNRDCGALSQGKCRRLHSEKYVSDLFGNEGCRCDVGGARDAREERWM
ncbi:hypothetical protein TWF281_010360 [Arthrobotrys megalospora]